MWRVQICPPFHSAPGEAVASFRFSVAGSVGHSGGARTESPSNGHPPVVSRAAAAQAQDCPAKFVGVKEVPARPSERLNVTFVDRRKGSKSASHRRATLGYLVWQTKKTIERQLPVAVSQAARDL